MSPSTTDAFVDPPELGRQPLEAWWMPFTHNRYFRTRPKLISCAEGPYYTLGDGRRLFDRLSGLWCSPLGHSHPRMWRVSPSPHTSTAEHHFHICGLRGPMYDSIRR